MDHSKNEGEERGITKDNIEGIDTQKAIEIVCVGREKLLSVNDCYRVISLLQQGKKYKEMWEIDAKDWLGNDLDLKEWMDETKQRYFPEGEQIE